MRFLSFITKLPTFIWHMNKPGDWVDFKLSFPPRPSSRLFNCHCGSSSVTLDKLYCKRKSWSKKLTHKLSLARTCDKRKFWVPTRIPTWVPRIMWSIYFVFLYLSIVQFRTLLISFSLPHAFRMFNDLVYALTRTFRCSLVGITSPELAEVADVRIIHSSGGLVLFFHFYLSLEMDNFIHSKACSTITVFPCSDSLIWTPYRRGRGRVSRIGYSWETVIIYHRGRGVGVFGGFWLCHNNFTWSALKAF